MSTLTWTVKPVTAAAEAEVEVEGEVEEREGEQERGREEDREEVREWGGEGFMLFILATHWKVSTLI